MIVARLMILLGLCLAAPAAAQDFPQLSGRVVDQANMLDPAQEVALTQKLEALEQASTRQLVVATIPDLQGYPIEDYGYRLGRAWKIGQTEADNGTILIVAPNERKVRIEVGYGLEPILTDAMSSLIVQNAILPAFKNGDFPGGINAGADAIIAQLQAPPEEAEARAAEAAQAQQPAARSSDGGSILPLIVWGMVLLFILMSVARGRSRRRFGRKSYGGSNWPIVLWAIANEMGKSSRHSGGGFGGWGGGGGGGWGGGGGFSGGGGSFGGGGASGSW